jgi:hypothetical protein
MGAGVDFTRVSRRGEGPPRRRRAVGEYYFTCLFKSFSGRAVLWNLRRVRTQLEKNNARQAVRRRRARCAVELLIRGDACG